MPPLARCGNHSSRPAITDRLKQPTRKQRGPRLLLPYLVLLRMGFTVPLNVTASAVSSYLAVSPLPDPMLRVTPPHLRTLPPQAASKSWGHRRSILCCTFRCLGSLSLRQATYSTQPLTGIPPCGARTFLPMPKLPPDIQRLPGRLSGANYTRSPLPNTSGESRVVENCYTAPQQNK